MSKRKQLTVEDVQEELDEIRSKADSDPESAHGTRDALYVTILQELDCRLGSKADARQIISEARKLVKETLKAEKIKLRWGKGDNDGKNCDCGLCWWLL